MRRPTVEVEESKVVTEDFPYLDITVRIYDTSSQPVKNGKDDSKMGLMVFTFASSDVTNSETGEALGSVGGGTGCVVVHVKEDVVDEDDHYMMIQHSDMWQAVTKALKEGNWRVGE